MKKKKAIKRYLDGEKSQTDSKIHENIHKYYLLMDINEKPF